MVTLSAFQTSTKIIQDTGVLTMEAAGLALSVYKDVYYLAKGIYRLGMSAQHYREENHQLLIKFRTQCLYLRMFKYFFIAVLRVGTSEALSEIEVRTIL